MAIAFDLSPVREQLSYLSRYQPQKLLRFDTPRLVIRRWAEEDLAGFAAMRLETLGMEFFPGKVSPLSSIVAVAEFEKSFDEHGYGFWVVQCGLTGEFMGSVGLYPRKVAGGSAQMGIGWQFIPEYWGHGYATEAARAVLEYAFKDLKLNCIFAIIQEPNQRSCRVAERLGMALMPNPRQAKNGAIATERLYRISRQQLRKITR